MQHPAQMNERNRFQRAAPQGMRHSRHEDRARKHLPKMLQSVACMVGTGKSHLAAALGHQACRRGHDVTFTTCSRLLAELAGGHADRSFAARVRKLAKITVLIVDLSGVLSHPSVTSASVA